MHSAQHRGGQQAGCCDLPAQSGVLEINQPHNRSAAEAEVYPARPLASKAAARGWQRASYAISLPAPSAPLFHGPPLARPRWHIPATTASLPKITDVLARAAARLRSLRGVHGRAPHGQSRAFQAATIHEERGAAARGWLPAVAPRLRGGRLTQT